MIERKALVAEFLGRLRAALPPAWQIEQDDAPPFAAEVTVRTPEGRRGGLQIDVPSAVTPGALEARLPRLRRLLGSSGQRLLVAAPYLSPASRQLLIAEDISYFDRTGNLRVVTGDPAIFLQDRGADRNPEPGHGAARSLRGDKTLAMVRALCDHFPPITSGALARVAGVTPGGASKLLAKLAHEGLIEREARGPVTSVAWRSLIEARAAEVDLLQSGVPSMYVPMTGGPQLMAALAAKARSGVELAVTGSYAVEDIGPIGGSRLFCYTRDAELLARDLPLRRESGLGHVVLLEPSSAAVFARTRSDARVMATEVPCVAYSQAAIDCLSGPDRMSEAGVAALDWMEQHEAMWRGYVPDGR